MRAAGEAAMKAPPPGFVAQLQVRLANGESQPDHNQH
jgi:hypothetical protein